MSDSELRVVFDTSVLISIAGRPTGNYTTWKAVLDGELVAVTCQSALDELRDVLSRPKIREHYGTSLDPVNVDRFIAGYKATCRWLSPLISRFVLRADPKDSLFFDLAIEARAHYLVTFDEVHVLAINRPEHPQHVELQALSPQLRIMKSSELAIELARLKSPNQK